VHLRSFVVSNGSDLVPVEMDAVNRGVKVGMFRLVALQLNVWTRGAKETFLALTAILASPAQLTNPCEFRFQYLARDHLRDDDEICAFLHLVCLTEQTGIFFGCLQSIRYCQPTLVRCLGRHLRFMVWKLCRLRIPGRVVRRCRPAHPDHGVLRGSSSVSPCRSQARRGPRQGHRAFDEGPNIRLRR